MAFILHLQGFVVVALAAANVARHVNVGQEVHLDALQAIALAGFAASALHVEAEAARLVTALARFGQQGIEIADRREQAGVGRRIRTGCAADRRLIDTDYFIDIRDAGNLPMRAGRFVGTIDLVRQRAIQNVIYERRLSAAGYAGHNDQTPQREVDVEALQIMLAGIAYANRFAVARTSYERYRDRQRARKIAAGE